MAKKVKKKKAGRPMRGAENRERFTIRMEPTKNKNIKKSFGGLQNWVDKKLEEDAIKGKEK